MRELFDVRSYYNVLVRHDNIYFPWRSILRNNVPLRMVFFAWLAASGKILPYQGQFKESKYHCGCLMLDLTTMFLFRMIILISFGGVFSGIMFP
jgi:hypothetical protein